MFSCHLASVTTQSVMAKIKVRHGESLEQALRRFSRMTQDTIDEYKDRMFFMKKSEKRRLEKKALDRKKYWERMKADNQ